jgi:hypothetical protein
VTGGPAGGRAADGHPPDRPPDLGLPAVSDWIRESGRLLRDRGGQVAAAGLAILVLPSIMLTVSLWNALADVRIDESEVSGWDSAQALPLVITGIVYVFAWFLFVQACTRQLLAGGVGRAEAWGDSVGAALVTLPRLVGYGLLAAIGLAVAWVVTVTIAVAAPVLLVVVVPAAVAAVVWVAVKLGFLVAAASGAARGTNLLRVSMAVSRGRFWPVAGRLLLVFALGWVAVFALNILTVPLTARGDWESGVEIDDDGTIRSLVFTDLFPNMGFLAVMVVMGTLVQGVQTAIVTAGSVLLYRDGGGDTSLVTSSAAEPPPP